MYPEFGKTTMNQNVFTYGSLMFDQVWNRVVGGSYQKYSARLYGFERRKIKGETYPAIIEATVKDWVDGQLYKNVSETDIDNLDRFEGEYYIRQLTQCNLPDGSGEPAVVYVFRQRYRSLLDSADWNPDWFANFGIHTFLSGYKGFE